MSVLALPRIHFQGRCLLNPATANNDDTVVEIDEPAVRIDRSIAVLSDAQARDFLLRGKETVSQTNGKTFFTLNCSWNYYGDASVRFQDVLVSSVVGEDGTPFDEDPIVGQPVRLRGTGGTHPVLCDVDPRGIAIAQMFIGGIVVGDDSIGLVGEEDTRGYSRWIVWRNAEEYLGERSFVRAAATWQFAIGNDCLEPRGSSDSPSLVQLLDAAGKGQGIQVQFCTYLVKPFLSDEELHQYFRAGLPIPNPAEAYVVGTIGVWEGGEPRTAIHDRLLRRASGPAFDKSPLANLGPAAARVHPSLKKVSLNLITAIPEANYDRPPTAKADLGPVRLGVILPGKPPIAISDPIDYGNDAYLRTGGIVDVPYHESIVTPEQLDDGTLVLLAEVAECTPGSATKHAHRRKTTPILTEADSLLTLETDDQAVYLDMDGQLDGEISVIVRERGRPPSRDVTISLWEYQFFVFPPEPGLRAHSRLLRLQPGVPLRPRIKHPHQVVFCAGRDRPKRIPVQALAPGSLTLAFTMDGNPPPDDFPLGAPFFMSIRILPKEDFSGSLPEERVSWRFMYAEVFRYYHMIFPAMSKIIPFDNQAQMEKHARKIVERTDPLLWHRTTYMPITRDLSRARRQLIVDWADHVETNGGEEGPSGR